MMDDISFGYEETRFDRLLSRFPLLADIWLWFVDGHWMKPTLVLLIVLMLLCLAELVYLTFFF